MKSNRRLTLKILAFIGVFIIILFAFSGLIIQDFSGPLSGFTGFSPWSGLNQDYVDIQEYNGFYFAKNLSFNPFPHLDLVNNQVFYPYGVNNVFNPWSFEADLFYALCYSFRGTGPWLQIYYLLTVLITAIGSFVLLKRDYSVARAFGAGLLVSFGNFYAIYKFPHHLQQSVIHWLTLGIIVDFLIVKRVVLKQHVSLRLILVRLCLLFLLLGHDLGYIAGFGLMSFTVSILFMAGLLYHRYDRRDFRDTKLVYQAIESYKKDFFAYPHTCLALLGLTITAAYLYLPLAIQIARVAESFDFTGAEFTTLWVNPLRILIPFLPGISKVDFSLRDEFHDAQETIFDGSPGLFLLILGIIGLWQNRYQFLIFIPLLVTFILCLLYIPGSLFSILTVREVALLVAVSFIVWKIRRSKKFFIALPVILASMFLTDPTLFLLPTLKFFPWFAFNRVGGRCTVIYPVILCLFALHIDFNRFYGHRKRIFAGLLIVLACLELGTVYSFRPKYEHPKQLDQSFFAYMNYVKKQPGEAVLDWPFCIAGEGVSGIETGNICPYYFQNSGVFALRRFHQKKVMGEYFGRLHQSQVKPYFQAGWGKLLDPGEQTSSHPSHCFNATEWDFFTNFFKFNDFAGINLYVDLLPKGCVAEFYRRFGSPVRETSVPGTGQVVFIPKSAKLRAQVNLALGKALKLQQ